MAITIEQAIAEASAKLHPQHDTAKLDAEVLLAHVLGVSRTWLRTWPEKTLPPEAETQFRELISHRTAGEPVAYLTGQAEFWSLTLEVTPATLIPRPETELLVERALTHIPLNVSWEIADLGTGSGAIALGIAKERPLCRITATDCSSQALEVARRNALTHQLTNITFLSGEWYAPLSEQKFHLIVSNPPYIAENDHHLSEGDVRYEPRSALAAGNDGLDDIRHIVAQGRNHLRPSGWLLLEHGYDQGNAVAALLHQHGYENIMTHRDLAGLVRITEGSAPTRA